MPSGATSARAEQIAGLLEPVVCSAGFDLEDLIVTQAGRRSVVKVIVDSDHGVSLDEVAELSRACSAELDGPGDDLVGRQAYTLEVTSPGVERPLHLPRHWRRNRHRLVSTSIDDRAVLARVLEADDDGVELEVQAAPGIEAGNRRIDYRRLGSGRVQVEFNRDRATADGAAADPHRGQRTSGRKSKRRPAAAGNTGSTDSNHGVGNDARGAPQRGSTDSGHAAGGPNR